MKYVDEYRTAERAQRLSSLLQSAIQFGRHYRFMEFCGGHTHALYRYGLHDLLPSSIEMVHGPGCPVCVLPVSRIAGAVDCAQRDDVILCTYGDLLRVPGKDGVSLLNARAHGANVKMVYSVLDALKLAKEHSDRTIVFFAVGFETTTPPTASAILKAEREGVHNFLVFCNHVLTPPAVGHILEAPEVRSIGTVDIDGFIGPGHVCVVIGSGPFEYFAEEFRKPVVIAGFEPLDVLKAIHMLVLQVNEQRAEVENEYTRGVRRDGNVTAQKMVAEVFELRQSFEWRGLGSVPYSALRLKERYAQFDAEIRLNLKIEKVPEPKGCLCGSVLRGARKPLDCALFGTACTPDHPVGSCMVSSEGACAAYFMYGKHRD
ncbi:MAG: hydrogenase formation protein HypD [Chitinivibrionales bacterium]|nr:hydrogenase formation protein HypD [Chitinivibrionales bacterium]